MALWRANKTSNEKILTHFTQKEAEEERESRQNESENDITTAARLFERLNESNESLSFASITTSSTPDQQMVGVNTRTV